MQAAERGRETRLNLQVEVQLSEHGIAVLTLSGAVDLTSAGAIREPFQALLGQGVKRVVLDLSAVKYLDSTGLGLLVQLQRRMRDASGDLCIVVTSQRLRRIFNLTALDRTFCLTATLEEALEHLQPVLAL
jgi:anti-sigma B factor antagonist